MWTGFNKKVYKALLNFFKVKGSYLRDNLAKVIFKIKKQYNILYKIFIIIANNAFNNNYPLLLLAYKA
jgi:hypothetical protein